MSGNDCQDVFIIESGGSQHISKDLSNFSSVEEIEPVPAPITNDRSVRRKEQGTGLLQLLVQHGGIMRITRVIVVNILNVSQPAVHILSCLQPNKAAISSRVDNGT